MSSRPWVRIPPAHLGDVAQRQERSLVRREGAGSSPVVPVSRAGVYPRSVARWRTVAIVVLSGVTSVATAAASAPAPSYTAAATRACLTNVPDAIVGLPPATPPKPPALFVHSFPPDRLLPRVHGKLGAWYGYKGAESYDGITLSFFTSVDAARTFFRSLPPLYGGKLIRNVVVGWESSPVPRKSLQRTVLGCLRAESAAGTPAPKRSTPRASLATFAGYWGGHTRGLRITSGGRAVESTNDGCCVRIYDMTFRILSVSGTLTRATAAYRVTSFKRSDRLAPRLRVGQVGKLLLSNGIVTNALTDVYFCSDPAWAATGACGA